MLGKELGQEMKNRELDTHGAEAHAPPGIVIHSPVTVPIRPSIVAFIWGGKVAPVPALPYGRRTA